MNTNANMNTLPDPAEQDELFAEALRLGWNREMDWLWLSTQVTNPVRQRHCLEKALKINPDSEVAIDALKSLTPPQQLSAPVRIKKLIALLAVKMRNA
jgi:hypothetical protein